MNQRKEEKQYKAKQGEYEIISLQALFICLCVCVYACAMLSLVLLISNMLWAHHASEVPRDLTALRLRGGSWGVGALELRSVEGVWGYVLIVIAKFTNVCGKITKLWIELNVFSYTPTCNLTNDVAYLEWVITLNMIFSVIWYFMPLW